MKSKYVFGFMTTMLGIVYPGVALAESEASYQSSTQSVVQGTSENGHVGFSQNIRECQAQITSQSMTAGSQENSSQASGEAGGIKVSQPIVPASGIQISALAVESKELLTPTQTADVPILHVVNYSWSKN